MKKRYIGKSSGSLVSGLVVFPGDTTDLSAKEWDANSHLAEAFINIDDEAKQDKLAPAKKSDKE